MFLLSPQTKVFLAKDWTDMRKSFRGLIILAEAVLQQDPASGHLFVFVNKRRWSGGCVAGASRSRLGNALC